MFDLAAPSLQTSPIPVASQNLVATNAPTASPEIAAVANDAPQTGMFQALLALQTAPAIAIPVAATPLATVRQPSGKVLPDAAIAVAFDPETAALSAEPASAGNDDPTALSPSAPLAYPPLPDLAVIAAIFAAPVPREATPDRAPEPTRVTQIQLSASRPPKKVAPTAAAIALAQTARIELEAPPASRTPAAPAAATIAFAQVALEPRAAPRASTEPAEATTAPAQTAQTPVRPRPAPEASVTVAAPAPETSRTTPATIAERPVKLASIDVDEPQAIDEAAEPASPLFQNAAPAASPQDAAPASRAEPRAERIDFATLVETLSRAREEASPNAVRASVQHTDFGRISLRFEQDDSGAMAVAMSSADPGFARAVTASNEAASTQTQPDTQRGQNTAHSQGDSPRQQPGSRHSQPTSQPGETPRRDEAKPQSDGIFA